MTTYTFDFSAPEALDTHAILADAAVAGRSAPTDALEEPLAVLTDSLMSEAYIHAEGRIAAGRRLRALTRAYLAVASDQAERPEIAKQPVRTPIFITGIPRSGTTMLHALLSADPEHRAPQWWEALRPSPPPEEATWASDPRRVQADAQFADMHRRNQDLASVLPYAADLVTECNTLVQPSLRSIAFTAAWHIPSYQSWYLRTDLAEMFRYHRRALQQLQWRVQTGRWVLKAPPHLLTCEALTNEYPNAPIIIMHRDPAKTMASGASLFHNNRVLHSDRVDPFELGREYLDTWMTAIDRFDSFRRNAQPDRIIDVRYVDLVADPAGTIAGIYADLDIEFSVRAETSVRSWLEQNARDKRPTHRYALLDFGLSDGRVREAFAEYIDKYQIESER